MSTKAYTERQVHDRQRSLYCGCMKHRRLNVSVIVKAYTEKKIVAGMSRFEVI